MILTAEEIGRAVSGSLKLLNRDEEGLDAFEVSIPAFWRSFAAMLLAAPAFVVALAEGRAELGLPSDAGLFSPGLVLHETVLFLAGWVAFPLAMIAILRRLGLGHRYVGYVIAWNWSAVVAATILAIPSAMHVLGLATSGLAILFACAFGIIIAQYRWFLAKTALGVSGGLAALLVLLDIGITGAVSAVLSPLI